MFRKKRTVFERIYGMTEKQMRDIIVEGFEEGIRQAEECPECIKLRKFLEEHIKE